MVILILQILDLWKSLRCLVPYIWRVSWAFWPGAGIIAIWENVGSKVANAFSFLQYMKMMGVNSCSHFFAWLIESIGFLLVTIVILIVILKFGNILPKTNGFILFLYFSDYSFSVIAMSYLISVFFNNTNIAALIGSLIYIIAFFPFIVLITVEDELSYVIKVFMVSQLSQLNGQGVIRIDSPYVFRLLNWKFIYLIERFYDCKISLTILMIVFPILLYTVQA